MVFKVGDVLKCKGCPVVIKVLRFEEQFFYTKESAYEVEVLKKFTEPGAWLFSDKVYEYLQKQEVYHSGIDWSLYDSLWIEAVVIDLDFEKANDMMNLLY